MNVLLVHGLGRTSWSLRRLGRALEHDGHTPTYFGYRPWAESYRSICDRLAAEVATLRGALEPYALIGHSLGGVLLRDALARTDGSSPSALVLLAVPARAPRAAQLAWHVAPFRWFARDAGRELAEWNAPGELPEPDYPCIAIAGTRGPRMPWTPFHGAANDGILAVEETRPGGGVRLATVHATHTFIMNHPDTRAIVRAALGGPAS